MSLTRAEWITGLLLETYLVDATFGLPMLALVRVLTTVMLILV